MSLIVPNFARTTLRASIMPASTQLPLAVGSGAYFNIGAGNYNYLTIEDGQSVEIVKYNCTGPVVNDIITVIRGVDGTTPKAFPAGSCVKVAWNVQQVIDLVDQEIQTQPDDLDPPDLMVADVPPPTETWQPPPGILYYLNRSTTVLRIWDALNSKWVGVAGGLTIMEEYWGKTILNDAAPVGVVVPNGTIELRDLGMGDRFRSYPHSDPSATNLVEEDHGGDMAVTTQRVGAMEISATIRGRFVSGGVPVAPIAGTMIELVISNNVTPSELYGNAITPINVNPARPDVVITCATGMLWWQAGTFFDGNVIYTVPVGSEGSAPNFELYQASATFHVAGSAWV